ncbi:MAG: DUF4129 domain-containing protein [Chloroflexi bacterium]|nr:DUF4129 domain-containing protein [Chloroflexota bacterium]
MIRRALVLALLLTALGAVTALAQAPATLDEYRRAIAQALSSVERAADEAAPETRQALLKQAAADLGAIRAVQLDSGAAMPVHNETLVAELDAAAQNDAPPDEILKIDARLHALGSQVGTIPIPPNPADRARLHDILDHPPFVTPEVSNPLNELLQHFLDWLSSVLGDVLGGVVNARDAVMVLGFVLVVALLIYFFRILVDNVVRESHLPTAGPVEAIASGGILHAAQAYAEQGDYRTAVRQLYLAALLILDEQRVLRYDHTLTNRELLREVAHRPRIRAALEPVVETFDRTWYGYQKISREDFELYLRRVQDMKNLAPPE